MQFVEFRKIIEKRASIDDEWYSEIEKCWEEMTALFSADVRKTIQLLAICTADEFVLMSEVIEDIAKKRTARILFLRCEELQINIQKKPRNITLLILLNRQNILLIKTRCFESEHMRKWVNCPEYLRNISLDIDYTEGMIHE